MTSVVLIHPKIEIISVKGRVVNAQPQKYVPLGLCYIAASLIKHNHSAEIIDLNAKPLSKSDFLNNLEAAKPDLIGIYCNSFNQARVKELVAIIKETGHTPIVLGGPHITHYPQAIKYLKADFGIRGEGEIAILELLDSVTKNTDHKNISGLSWLEDDKLIDNGVAIIADLDQLAFPARHLIDANAYHIPVEKGLMTSLISSKGCSHKCIFCSLINHKACRFRSPESVVEEMEMLEGQGYKYIDFHDPSFTMQKARIFSICDLIIQKDIKITWGCETRADIVDEEILTAMKKAGCVNVRFGIESGVERIRNKVIKKGVSDKSIVAAFKAVKKAKLESMAFFMFGHPGETLKDMKSTVSFAKKIKPQYADFSISIPLPGSELFDIAVKDGTITYDCWQKVSDGYPVPLYSPKGVLLDDIIELRKTAYRSQYLSLANIVIQLRNIKNLTDLLNKVKAGLKIIGNSQKDDAVIW